MGWSRDFIGCRKLESGGVASQVQAFMVPALREPREGRAPTGLGVAMKSRAWTTPKLLEIAQRSLTIGEVRSIEDLNTAQMISVK